MNYLCRKKKPGGGTRTAFRGTGGTEVSKKLGTGKEEIKASAWTRERRGKRGIRNPHRGSKAIVGGKRIKEWSATKLTLPQFPRSKRKKITVPNRRGCEIHKRGNIPGPATMRRREEVEKRLRTLGNRRFIEDLGPYGGRWTTSKCQS